MKIKLFKQVVIFLFMQVAEGQTYNYLVELMLSDKTICIQLNILDGRIWINHIVGNRYHIMLSFHLMYMFIECPLTNPLGSWTEINTV